MMFVSYGISTEEAQHVVVVFLTKYDNRHYGRQIVGATFQDYEIRNSSS